MDVSIHRPTIQDIYNNVYGSGNYIKFNSNGSIYMKFSNNETLYFDADDQTEDVYDEHMATTCHSLSCYCKYD